MATVGLDETWRSRVANAQEAALPSGSVAVTCNAPFGGGGLGRHLQEIALALDRSGRSHIAVCSAVRPGLEGTSPHRTLRMPSLQLIQRLPPLRFSPAWRAWAGSVMFDRWSARQLPDMEHIVAFNGQALAQLQAHQRRMSGTATLVSANSHIRRVVRQHARACGSYSLERSWAASLVGRNCAEYERADRIFVSSTYMWESFVEEGVSEERLVRFPLSPDRRYAPDPAGRRSSTFDIVYVGSLTVAKGVPLLIDAFRQIARPDMRLRLVGGWATREMRRFIERACVADPRISVSPGDPLPHLRTACVAVHPTFEDGFAYAPAEALACDIPVIVSEDTGMKELIDPGHTGHVFPTGDVSALAEALSAAYRGELLSGSRGSADPSAGTQLKSRPTN